MSSAYHPQTDGQTERLNQCLEAFLRCSVHSCPRQWHKWIFLAEYWYNTTFQSSLGHTPFEVLYGHPPRHFGITNIQDCIVPDLEAWQQRMKHQADAHRSERQFSVGDLVYLKLQPHIQSSVAPRSNNKLLFRFYGPFKVLQRVGAVAYKLELPPLSRIHPVIHVSQLKRHVPAPTEVTTDLSSVPTDPDHIRSPVAVLARTLVPRAGSTAARIQVQWTGLPPSLATWEDEHDIRRRFPAALA
ncbi:hypothetical protein BS78_01G047300 [Paspalum vaginatum]|nr:hypothetical protein BS78_01G047300 [Paspalum vaginatum]